MGPAAQVRILSAEEVGLSGPPVDEYRSKVLAQLDLLEAVATSQTRSGSRHVVSLTFGRLPCGSQVEEPRKQSEVTLPQQQGCLSSVLPLKTSPPSLCV